MASCRRMTLIVMINAAAFGRLAFADRNTVDLDITAIDEAPHE